MAQLTLAEWVRQHSHSAATLGLAHEDCEWKLLGKASRQHNSSKATTASSITRCVLPARATLWGEHPAEWRVLRIGPRTTTGGNIRHAIRTTDDRSPYAPTRPQHEGPHHSTGGLIGLLGLEGSHHFVEFAGGMVGADAAASWLPLPDYHLHHFNTLAPVGGNLVHESMPPFSMDWAGGPFVQVSDWIAEPDGGGGIFEHRLLPRPYVYESDPMDGLLVDAVLEDLRPAGSPPFTWFVEFAMLRLLDVGERPARPRALKPVFGLVPDELGTWASYATFSLPADTSKPSVNYLTIVHRRGLRVLSNRVHSHTHTAGDELWLVSGSPADCGLGELQRFRLASDDQITVRNPEAALALRAFSIANRTEAMRDAVYDQVSTTLPMSLADAKLSALAHVAKTKGRARVLCRFRFLADARSVMIFNAADVWACDEQQLVLRAGERTTLVAFNGAQLDHPSPRQHMLWLPWVGLDVDG